MIAAGRLEALPVVNFACSICLCLIICATCISAGIVRLGWAMEVYPTCMSTLSKLLHERESQACKSVQSTLMNVWSYLM